ncbi:SusD/RagB family nutrient-binding outer membrane lipoprotein [Dyadobacter sp. CY107]|uniref:SusD/RagB family nutrient-binding outer membrane lipoprotein n=1 Tax=Dyadobacter fanqingshengii TaxID=2906443 RepID=UPI001F45466B|nr:SusD/RagB family nutrient-binding outer membrane lipoprotein [Dyadobacter fanqingshengii]MCF2504354.1 SusD/RagB family nutrient-binding outer membrane lipoprotein [Dyadobacter fanqingshengii]
MKKLIIFFLPVLLLTACVDSLDDYNVDQKRATVVPPVTLFSNALKGLADTLTSPNVNVNNYRLYVQHWSTTTYLDEPRYNLTARTIPQAFWQGLYKGVISDLTEAKRLLNEDALLSAPSKEVQLAQIEIIEVLAWADLVNTFGNIPYTEAMNPENPLPKYDDAKTIYDDLLARLDAALPKLNTTGTPFEDGDLLYKGDIALWKKFGNSLKLKLAMIIADSDPAKAKTMVAQAATNVFTSNADKAAFPYIGTPPNYNPIAQNLNPLYSTRQDFVASETLVNPMNELNDPRREQFFTAVGGKYIGGKYGMLNTYSAFSHVADKIIEPDLEGLLLDYSEVEFLLAEAIERGFITGSAAEHYNKAVTASITYWGGTAAQATAYLAQPKVAYATAAATWKEKIGFQKWIALYNRGWESWVEWRRLDSPKLLPPSGGNVPAGLAIPVRMIYPINEQTLNPANRESAASAIGGDLATTKLWWDKF